MFQLYGEAAFKKKLNIIHAAVGNPRNEQLAFPRLLNDTKPQRNWFI